MFEGERRPQCHHVDRRVVEVVFVVLVLVEIVAREAVAAAVVRMVLGRVRNEVLPDGIGPCSGRLGRSGLGSDAFSAFFFVFVR